MLIIIKAFMYAAGALIAVPFAWMAGPIALANWLDAVQRISDNLKEEIEKYKEE